MKRAPNRPYIQAMKERSPFYARCIPDDRAGNKGTTTIYRVRKEGDEEVDIYNWYSPGNLVLGWSPIAGKVAIMSLLQRGMLQEEQKALTQEEQIEFSFYIGGKFLHSCTTADMENMGVKIGRTYQGERAQFKVLGCIQVPLTNDYDFVIESSDGKNLAFDILTGKLRD